MVGALAAGWRMNEPLQKYLPAHHNLPIANEPLVSHRTQLRYSQGLAVGTAITR
jgi:hypothetical protein